MNHDLFHDLRALKLMLDKDAFASALSEWTSAQAADLRRIIQTQFGDANLTSASIAHAVEELHDWPLDSLTREALVHLGDCDPGDAEALESRLLPLRQRLWWFLAALHPDRSFASFSVMSVSRAAAFVRGVALAEENGCSRFRGSVSFVCPAFAAFRGRYPDSWFDLADWLVRHSANPWVPFGLRAMRANWEASQAPGRSPDETWREVCMRAERESRERHYRANRHAVHVVIDELRAGRSPAELSSLEVWQQVVDALEHEAEP